MSGQAGFWTPDGMRAAAGGTWLARPADPACEITGVSIDSRAVERGQVFIAIKGDRTDGHLYVAEAARRGAVLAIVSEAVEGLPPEFGVLRVADTRTALLRLGAAWRKLLDGTRVVAVVGSNGKTTTVRLIDAALGAAMRGSASIKSFNNSIGVPLTILGARRGDQYLVCEVGTSAPGEIASLSQVVQPDVAVITSIGREHLEFLGSLKGVATEESSVLDHVRPGGIGVVAADSPELEEVLRARGARRGDALPPLIRFGPGPGADVRVVRSEQGPDGTTFELNDRAVFAIPLIGAHNAWNAAAAIAVARRFRVDDADIRRGLASTTGAAMRLERRRVGEIELINDAYNANPDSVMAAIGTLTALEPGTGGRRVLILGDMLELGPEGPGLHDEVVRAAAGDASIERIALVGPLMAARAGIVRATRGEARVVAVGDSSESNARSVAEVVRPGDVVLLKGSRGMRLERIAEAIAAVHGGNERAPHGASAGGVAQGGR